MDQSYVFFSFFKDPIYQTMYKMHISFLLSLIFINNVWRRSTLSSVQNEVRIKSNPPNEDFKDESTVCVMD